MITIDDVRDTYTARQHRLTKVVQELEQDLERMQKNEKIPQQFKDKRDEQIEVIVDFNNASDQLVELLSSGKILTGSKDINNEIQTPQALDLEERILGAIMLEKNTLYDVAGYLNPRHFYSDAHRLIYQAILDLLNIKAPVDMSTVVLQLRRSGNIDLIGGAYKIAELTAKVSSAANIEYHARCMIEFSIKRQLIEMASDIQKKGCDDTCDVFDLIDTIEDQFKKIQSENILPKQSR
jgi:hypothetical protein